MLRAMTTTSILTLLGLACLTLAATACGPKTPDAVLGNTFKGLNATHHCIDTASGSRCYFLVVPNEVPSKLIVALHPAFYNVADTEGVVHFAPKAVAAGYGIAFPEGIDKQWNDGRHAEESLTFREGTDDVAFLNAAITDIQQKLEIDARSTMLVGMSNGGMMAQRMACQSDAFTATATVVANLPKGIDATCTAKPKAMLMLFGTADGVVPPAGGSLGKKPHLWGEVLSAEDTIAFFARRNSATRLPSITRIDAQDDKTVAEHRVYGDASPMVEAYMIENMGHTWPNEPSQFFAWVTTRGRVTREVDAADAILAFADTVLGEK